MPFQDLIERDLYTPVDSMATAATPLCIRQARHALKVACKSLKGPHGLLQVPFGIRQGLRFVTKPKDMPAYGMHSPIRPRKKPPRSSLQS